MENRIYDENNGLWYAKQGDYYLPELALPYINVRKMLSAVLFITIQNEL